MFVWGEAAARFALPFAAVSAPNGSERWRYPAVKQGVFCCPISTLTHLNSKRFTPTAAPQTTFAASTTSLTMGQSCAFYQAAGAKHRQTFQSLDHQCDRLTGGFFSTILHQEWLLGSNGKSSILNGMTNNKKNFSKKLKLFRANWKRIIFLDSRNTYLSLSSVDALWISCLYSIFETFRPSKTKEKRKGFIIFFVPRARRVFFLVPESVTSFWVNWRN